MRLCLDLLPVRFAQSGQFDPTRRGGCALGFGHGLTKRSETWLATGGWGAADLQREGGVHEEFPVNPEQVGLEKLRKPRALNIRLAEMPAQFSTGDTKSTGRLTTVSLTPSQRFPSGNFGDFGHGGRKREHRSRFVFAT